MNAISLKNLSKKYKVYPTPASRLKELFNPTHARYHREFWALRDIDFEVLKGQTVGIIGENGSGKSTLLKLIAQTTYPTTGSVYTEGKLSTLLELGAGFHLDFSGRDNIYLNASLLGLSEAETNEILDDIIEFSELGEFIDQPVRTYSAGMILRLGFSVAVHVDFDILLVDEILAVGDLLFQRKCVSRFRRFKDSGKTILIASHNLGDMGAFCDRLLLLKKGKIELDGESDEVIQRYMEECDRKQSRIDKRLNPFKLESIYGRDTKDISIVEVKLLDKNRDEKETFYLGEGLIVSIKFRALRKVKNPLFRVQFFRNDGLWVHGSNTYRQGLELGELEGEGEVELCYDRLNLLEADYFVNVGIWPDEYRSFVTDVAYDLHEFAYKISVKSKREDGGGIVYNPGRWRLVRD